MVALLGLVEAVFVPGTRVLLVSRSHRQSRELFRIVLDFHRRLRTPMLARRTAEELELDNHRRIVSLPCREETIRGYAHVNLLIIDEAARVPDDLYRAVRPMLAVSNGRLICLSTPYGKRGFFHHAWARGGDDWQRVEVPAARVPRIAPEFLEEERRALGESWFRQEYCCSFESQEGLVYPDFARCVVAELPAHVSKGPPDPRRRLDPAAAWAARWGEEVPASSGKRVGGIDFGFRNPFAAVWGTHDRDGILWLTGEHYASKQPLSYHAACLPRDVLWYADPAGATERMELSLANLRVWPGNNALRLGIAAVTARLESGTLKVLQGACPNLLAEAELYRYAEAGQTGNAEEPLNEHNHALAALRYLIVGLARPRKPASPEKPTKPRLGPRLDDPDIWTRIL